MTNTSKSLLFSIQVYRLLSTHAMWLRSYTAHWKLQLPFDTKDNKDISVTTHTAEKKLECQKEVDILNRLCYIKFIELSVTFISSMMIANLWTKTCRY